MTDALRLKNVSKKYSDFVLNDVSITLPQGCIMGFIGENGAGKSTTIKLILDLIKRDSGTIEILGQDNKKGLKDRKEDIGVVIDESCFPENLNARNINYIMKNIYKNWDETAFKGLLSRFSLPEDKAVKDYSRGMKMKLSIAAALSHDAKLLILDEATSGLDPIARDEILDVFFDFIQDERHSIFMSSHIISDLEKICDYITFIHKGKVLFSQTKDELTDTYGMLRCAQSAFNGLDQKLVRGWRKSSFGVEALVYKNKLDSSYTVDNAGIEDIMLFLTKEESL